MLNAPLSTGMLFGHHLKSYIKICTIHANNNLLSNQKLRQSKHGSIYNTVHDRKVIETSKVSITIGMLTRKVFILNGKLVNCIKQ